MRGFERKEGLGVLLAGKDEDLHTVHRSKDLRKNTVTEIHTVLTFKQKPKHQTFLREKKT